MDTEPQHLPYDYHLISEQGEETSRKKETGFGNKTGIRKKSLRSENTNPKDYQKGNVLMERLSPQRDK